LGFFQGLSILEISNNRRYCWSQRVGITVLETGGLRSAVLDYMLLEIQRWVVEDIWDKLA